MKIGAPKPLLCAVKTVDWLGLVSFLMPELQVHEYSPHWVETITSDLSLPTSSAITISPGFETSSAGCPHAYQPVWDFVCARRTLVTVFVFFSMEWGTFAMLPESDKDAAKRLAP
jgi:hypothetical protein